MRRRCSSSIGVNSGASRAWPGRSTVAGWRTAFRTRRRRWPSSLVRSRRAKQRSSPIRRCVIHARRSIPKASTCTSSASATTTRCMTNCTSTWAFRKALGNPFILRPKPPESQEVAALKKAEAEVDKTPPAPPRVEIDLDGIADRALVFPVKEGRYGRIAGIKGKALFTTYPIEGARGRRNDEESSSRGVLESYEFETQKQERLVDGVSDFSISRDSKTLLYQSGERLRVLKAGEKVPDKKDDKPGRESGWIDLGRVKVSIQPAAEWRQMFQEAWRLQREQFWTEDLSGIDWDAVHRLYRPLVDRVTTRAEFSDLLWELQGELGTSHAYESGGEYRQGPDYRQGSLGVDWEYDSAAGVYRIRRIVEGDAWDRAASSPLTLPGVDIRA